MRFSFSRLTLTAATTALFAFGVMGDGQPAWAARMLAPVSDWSVNKIDVQEGHAYCTMVRHYDANAVLTFAKNAVREGTIAFDFQRNAFDLTRAYPVTLQAGAETRQYSVRPASNSAIIMRTSTDEGLFRAMAQSGALNVMIDDESFTVDLSGYTNAFRDLEECSGAQPVIVADGDKQVRPPMIAPRADLQDHVAQQDKQVSALVSENADLVKTLENERSSFREKLARDRAARQGIAGASANTANPQSLRESQLLEQLAEAESNNAALLRRIAGLEERLANTGVSLNPDINAAIRERDQQIAALLDDNGKLHKMLETERMQRGDIGAKSSDGQDGLIRNLEQQIASLQQQNNELQKALNAERMGSRRQSPEVVVKEVIREVPVATGVMGNDEWEERLVEAETAVLSAQAERDEYRALLQRERARLKEMADIGQQIGTVDNSQSNMTETIRRLEEEKINLIRQLEYAKRGGDLSKVETASAADVQQLQARLDSLLSESENAKKQLRAMAADKQALESQLNAARLQLAEAQKQKSSDRIQQIVNHGGTGASPEIRTLEAEIAALEAQNLALREDMAARANRGNAVLDEQYNRRLQMMEQENIRLSQALAAEKSKQGITETRPIPRQPEIVNAAPQPLAPQPAMVQDLPQVVVADQRVSEPVPLDGGAIRRENSARLRNKITGKPIDVATPVAAVATVPVVATPLAQPVPQQQVNLPAAQPAPVQQQKALSGDEIRQLVSRAQIPLATQVERVPNVSGPDFAAFRWDTGYVYGSAEQSVMPNAAAFQQSVNQYINKTQSRCAGAFDKTIVPVAAPNGLQASAVDIACIDNNVDGAAASVLFFAHNGMFYALAHESGIADLQTAMDMRDKLAMSLGSVF